MALDDNVLIYPSPNETDSWHRNQKENKSINLGKCFLARNNRN